MLLASIILCSHSAIAKLICTLEYLSFKMDCFILYSFQTWIGSRKQLHSKRWRHNNVAQVISFISCHTLNTFVKSTLGISENILLCIFFFVFFFLFFFEIDNWRGIDIGLVPVVVLFVYFFTKAVIICILSYFSYQYKSSDLCSSALLFDSWILLLFTSSCVLSTSCTVLESFYFHN